MTDSYENAEVRGGPGNRTEPGYNNYMQGSMKMETYKEIESFIEQWPESPDRNKELFQKLYDFLKQLDGTAIDFHARPGITYSMRGVPDGESEYALFTMVDVIEDQPRWLSVCFYEQMVTDPDGKGDSVPGGLLGEDAICFDAESYDDELLNYLCTRIAEACMAVSEQ